MKTTTVKTMIAAIACLATMSATTTFAAEGTYTSSVTSYLQQIVSPADSSRLAGSSAVITISYGKNGQFDQAAIAGAGDINLARTLHRIVDWKQFPSNGKSETILVVAVNTAGSFNVTVR